MLVSLAAAAALIVNDRYEPAGEVAWLCPQAESAAEVGLKVESHAVPALVRALAEARQCVSWQAGAMNIRGAKRVGAQEVGLIRLVMGAGPEISYWVAGNTLRSASPAKGPATKR